MRTNAMDQAARKTFASIMLPMRMFAPAGTEEPSSGEFAKAPHSPIANMIGVPQRHPMGTPPGRSGRKSSFCF